MKMYSVKAFNDSSMKVELPTCMYRMKPIALICDEAENNHDLEKLLKRQDEVLARLDILKKKADDLKANFSCVVAKESESSKVFVSNKEIPKTEKVLPKAQTETVQSSQFNDLVIRADPTKPPVSLFILKSFLNEQNNVHCSTFVHSSAKDVPDKLRKVFDSEKSVDRQECKYAITLIWRKSEVSPSLITSPTKDVTIIGEFTIARHLGRLLTPCYEDLDIDLVAQIDDLLDKAASFKLNGSPLAKDMLDFIDKKLSKSAWLVGNSLSLADIALWSVVYSDKKTFGKLPKNVEKWFNACSSQPQFKNLP